MRRFGRRVGGGEAARGGEGDDRRAGFLRALDMFEPHRGAALAQSSASFVDDDSGQPGHHVGIAATPGDRLERTQIAFLERSEELRVGKECVITCSCRGSQYHYKNNLICRSNKNIE